MVKPYFSSLVVAAMVLGGCMQEQSAGPQDASQCRSCEITGDSVFSAEDEPFLEVLENEGFQRRHISRRPDGFMVEGDMFFRLEDLIARKGLAKKAQRMHPYLVDQDGITRVRVRIDGSLGGGDWANAVRDAMMAWNGTNSKLRMVEVSSGANITVYSDQSTDPSIPIGLLNLNASICGASIGPLTNGAPGGYITLNQDLNLLNAYASKVATITHELGHTIGFKHTDDPHYTLIPGTLTDDDNSIMESGMCGFTDRSIDGEDRFALNVLYPKLEDVMVRDPALGRWELLRGNKTSFAWGGNPLSNWPIGTNYTVLAGDANGDGVMDIIANDKSTGTWEVSIGTRTYWISHQSSQSPNLPPTTWLTNWVGGNLYTSYSADVNGDGYADLIAREIATGRWYVALGTGTSFSPAGIWMQGFAVGSGYNCFMGDVDRDGRADVIAQGKANGKLYTAKSSGSAFVSPAQWGVASASVTGTIELVGDVNRDGRVDYISKNNAGTWYVGINNGSAFQALAQWGAGFGVGDGYAGFMGDVTGDGRADIILRDKPSSFGRWYVYESNGTAFVNPAMWYEGVFTASSSDILVGDFDRY
jgi:hypothetical protein